MTSPAATSRPADRYGGASRRPLGLLVVVSVLGAAFLGWVIWAAVGAAEPEVGAQVTRFSVVSDDAIDVTVRPEPRAPGRFSCTVRVLDRDKAVVGVASVTLDGNAPGRPAETVRVETRDRAVAALVGACTPR